MVNQRQVDHFERQGFILIPNPFAAEKISWLDRRQRGIEPEWEKRDWPDGFNKGACQFLMMGEPLLAITEEPALLDMARRLLYCDEIHIGACGMGDASKTVSADGRPQQQVQWHADGGPEVKQVSLRTALDRHTTENAPLRVLPGSHKRPRDEVEEELCQLELAGGEHSEPPAHCFARHPHEVEVKLDPRWTLVWTPSCWHATGIKTAPGRRRAMAWNYFPKGGRHRDGEAVKYLYADTWRDWSEDRKRLWGLN
jgi:hypothetical protein